MGVREIDRERVKGEIERTRKIDRTFRERTREEER